MIGANEAAKFYINDVLLPITPAEITIKNSNQNLVFQTADGKPATLAQLDSAQSFSFDFIIPNQKEAVAFNDELQGIRFYTDLVWQIKQDRDPVVITITRPNGVSTNVRALLDDYSYSEDAEKGSDYYFSVTFTEYNEWNNLEGDVFLNEKLEEARSSRDWRGI